MRFWSQSAAVVGLVSFLQAGHQPRAVLCAGAGLTRADKEGFPCGDRSIPRLPSTRLILIHTNLREGDGLEQYLTGLPWPLDFGGAPVPAKRADYVIASWRESGEDLAAVYPVEAGAWTLLATRFRTNGYSLLDAAKARQDLRRRIDHAPRVEHARKYLGLPFRLADFHLSGGTYEFTMLENPDGLDFLCVENQALIASRRWWLVPAHIIPTDDKRSVGVITWDNPTAAGRKVVEVRFPLRKVRVLDE